MQTVNTDIENTENTDIENIENTDIENTGTTENIENIENTDTTENVDTTENTDTENIENTDTTENVENAFSVLQTAYRFDEHGHYMNAEQIMLDPITSAPLMPDDCVSFAPDAEKLKTCWAKLNSDHSEWTYQVKPTTAKECIGISVKHEDQCPWAYEVRDLFEKLCAADSEHYRVVRDANLVQTVEAIPEKTFEELKTEKLQTLSAEASRFQAWNCKDMHIKSSLGFEINSDQCSQNNIQILIGMLPDDTTTTSFKIYDNTFKALTKPQLNILLSECEQAGLALYQTKFALQSAIEAAKTKEDLDAIKIEFVMMNFFE